MGSGLWSTNVYDEHNRYKAAAGKSTFDYSDTLHSSNPATWRVHETLNPFRVIQRESRDNDEHPESNSIVVMFDVTGSMGEVPVALQKKLPELLGLLLRKSYISDPQIMFGAIGDATCDRIPLQVGQFESDNRMDDNLENIFLEGGGGGQRTESYELAMYFVARHTDIDCWNKRNHKGYFFIIGDEMAYSEIKTNEVAQYIGDDLKENISVRAMVKELQRRYHVFYILPKAASYGGDKEILGFWKKLLGENVLELEDASLVSEIIGLTIGMVEGSIDLSRGAEDLNEFGVDAVDVRKVTTALVHLPIPPTLVKSPGQLLPALKSLPALPGMIKRL